MKTFAIYYCAIGIAYATALRKVSRANAGVSFVRFLLWPVHLIGFLFYRYGPRVSAPVSCDSVGHYQTGNARGGYWCARCKKRRSNTSRKGVYTWN